MVRLRLAYAGICGTDLHYYHMGRAGNAIIREPMVLGHEMSGIVDKLGPNVDNSLLKPGMPVTINPSTECRECAFCRSGRQNLCPALRYFGSAARNPHVQGIMQEFPVVQARHCLPLAPDLPLDIAACVEPLAIALHAVARAGNLLGKSVLIIGAGPLGALIAAVAKQNGAFRICITDVEDFPLAVAAKLGADTTINVRRTPPTGLENTFEVCFEAAGSLDGVNTALEAVAPGGVLVHVGFLPEEIIPYPVNTKIVRKEISVLGSLRAYHEFPLAVSMLQSRRLDLSPLVTATYPLEKIVEALEVASDKTRSMKVLLYNGREGV